ncbi:sensor histidine kinase [Spirosoma sp. KNUC1025]|uniref:sensor histidine kinase n=1 Tax=Spirosoma sp. KNUC1025 TaxID=2894082 RepID=UPI00386BA391|nr:histidine kinase [Spirosoma sp. KNUC1025]
MVRILYQRLTKSVSKWELGYHALFVPVLIPVCNYYFIGPKYFTDVRLFLSGSILLLALYVLTTLIIRKAVRWAISHYPDVEQSTQRTLTLLVVLSSLSAGAVLFDVFIYSLIPAFGTQFSWVLIRPVMILTLFFDFTFCTALSLSYAYQQWHNDQTANEYLRQATYQHQLDALKMQINPHFLFNSLTSLSSLIGENRQKAGQFVDELAKVYRYLLQANDREWVSLKTELNFIVSYGNLLQTRYGPGLSITHEIDPAFLESSLLPLSLQTLVDNAIKHNAMSLGKPLQICIKTTPEGDILVQNNLQRKVVKVETLQASLDTLRTKYRLLRNIDIRVEETDTHFCVRLPLQSNYPIIEQN